VRNYFLDASALVKVYSEEEGSQRVRSMLRGLTTVPAISRVVVSVLAHPETASALGQIMSGPYAARRGFGAHDTIFHSKVLVVLGLEVYAGNPR